MAALDKRPNQAPLIAALQNTLAFQTRNKMRGQAQQPAPATIGINQYDPTNPGALGGFGVNPGGGAPRRRTSTSRSAPSRRARPTAARHPGLPAGPWPASCWPATVLYNPRLRRAYRIEDGIPVLLVDEAVTIDDDAEHQRLHRASRRLTSPGRSPVR